MEKAEATHLEEDTSTKSPSHISDHHCEHVPETAGFEEDKARSRRLVRTLDLHILPLCAWIYLLNYLDRGNVSLVTRHRLVKSGSDFHL
jgi:hypothetical protein